MQVPTPMPPSVTPQPESPSGATRPVDQVGMLSRQIASKYRSGASRRVESRCGTCQRMPSNAAEQHGPVRPRYDWMEVENGWEVAGTTLL